MHNTRPGAPGGTDRAVLGWRGALGSALPPEAGPRARAAARAPELLAVGASRRRPGNGMRHKQDGDDGARQNRSTTFQNFHILLHNSVRIVRNN